MDSFRNNIKNLHFVLLKKDDASLAEYDTKYDKVPGTMSVKVVPKVASGKMYGDGIVRDTMDKITNYEISLEHNKISHTLLAKYMGREIIAGVLRENAKDQSLFFALGYEVEQTNNTREMVWFTKCKITASEKNVKQSTDNVEYSTDAFNITAMPLTYNMDLLYLGDTSDTEMEFTDVLADKWFEKVPVMPPKAKPTTLYK